MALVAYSKASRSAKSKAVAPEVKLAIILLVILIALSKITLVVDTSFTLISAVT